MAQLYLLPWLCWLLTTFGSASPTIPTPLPLVVVHLNTTLPAPFASAGAGTGTLATSDPDHVGGPFALHDRRDTIFIIGTFQPTAVQVPVHDHQDYEIVKYSIKKESFSRMTGHATPGYAVWAAGHIYLFSTRRVSGTGTAPAHAQELLVTRVDLEMRTNSHTSKVVLAKRVSHFTQTRLTISAAWDENEFIYMVCGVLDGGVVLLYRLSVLGSHSLEEIPWKSPPSLPPTLAGGSVIATGYVSRPHGGGLHVLEGGGGRQPPQMWLFNPKSGEMGRRSVGMNGSATTAIGRMLLAKDGNMFLFHRNSVVKNGAADDGWRLLVWDPTTQESRGMGTGHHFSGYSGLASVYVPKLNIIYCFGDKRFCSVCGLEKADGVLYIELGGSESTASRVRTDSGHFVQFGQALLLALLLYVRD